VIVMAAQKRLICVCGERQAGVSCGLVAAAMIWSLTLNCHWRELGTSLWVREVAGWQIRHGVTGARPPAVVLAARSAGAWRS
jgi:hypothetical protein